MFNFGYFFMNVGLGVVAGLVGREQTEDTPMYLGILCMFALLSASFSAQFGLVWAIVSLAEFAGGYFITREVAKARQNG